MGGDGGVLNGLNLAGMDKIDQVGTERLTICKVKHRIVSVSKAKWERSQAIDN